jgi:hypothetical protein
LTKILKPKHLTMNADGRSLTSLDYVTKSILLTEKDF